MRAPGLLLALLLAAMPLNLASGSGNAIDVDARIAALKIPLPPGGWTHSSSRDSGELKICLPTRAQTHRRDSGS